jgi:hypothetical protein
LSEADDKTKGKKHEEEGYEQLSEILRRGASQGAYVE